MLLTTDDLYLAIWAAIVAWLIVRPVGRRGR